MTFATTEYPISERQACRLLEVDRSSYRYEAEPDRNAGLRLVNVLARVQRFDVALNADGV